MRRGTAWCALALAMAAVLSACGGDEGVRYPRGAESLVLRVATEGGFVPPSFTLRAIPEFSLYGDGSLITPGPQIEIYPPPALPSVQVTRLTDAGIRAILAAARRAGLYRLQGNLALPPGMGVADAGTTTFTVVEPGRTHRVSVYALGLGGEESGDRKALTDLRNRLLDAASIVPAGSIRGQSSYEFTRLRVVVLSNPRASEPSEPLVSVLDWPLAVPLSAFGAPALAGLRCGVVSGADLARLLPVVRGSNELTQWRSAGDVFQLAVRPSLPDERSC